MNKEDVKYIVVHCSYTPPEMDIGVDTIDKWHRAKGWLMVGYHIVIKRDGTVEQGRKLTQQGAHVRRINKKSVGICLIGGMNSAKDGPEENYTDAQWEALRQTIDDLKANHFPDAEVRGHVDFDKGKTCPNFDADHWYETAEIISKL